MAGCASMSRRNLDAALAALVWPRATARLRLRPLTVEDAAAASLYRCDPEVTRYLRHGRLTPEQVVERHRDRVRRMQPGAPDPMLALAIEDATGMVGDCMLELAPPGEPDADLPWTGRIGYSLAPSAQGQGYATEVARELVAIARQLGLAELRATTRPANAASQRVLARAGFTRTGPPPDDISWLFHRRLSEAD